MTIGGLDCARPGPRTSAPAPRPQPPASAARTLAEAPTASAATPPEAVATATPAAPPAAAVPATIRMIAVGDIMLGRSVGERIAKDPSRSPFTEVADTLAGADIAVGNLECVLAPGGTAAKKAFTFRAPPEALPLLKRSGLDVVLVANNHILDFGTEPLGPMLAALDEAGIRHAGAGLTEAEAHAPTIVTARGLRVAFLGYVNVPAEGTAAGFDTRKWEAKGSLPGVAWAEPLRVGAEVAEARTRADLVIVLLHAGSEEMMMSNAIQHSVARAAIDHGASAVLGTHPHRLQAIERYHGGLIAYSLGDFVFDGRDILTAMLELELDRGGVRSSRWIPMHTSNGYPKLHQGPFAAHWRGYIEHLPPPPPPPKAATAPKP
ncbi:MAG TPA: CapA family protein [Polyangiaceae bacterium]|nr:CapA family protein [Polyangiaceae bacterium]